MSVSVSPDVIVLEYVCNDHDKPVTAEQSLADISNIGTLVCPDCDEDMALVAVRILG